MKWALAQLRKLEKPFTFEYDYDLMSSLVNKDDIIAVKKCHIIGKCYEVAYEEYMFELDINADLVMQCAISLLDVDVPLNLQTTVRFSYLGDDSSDDYPIIKDTIDLDTAVLSEIVLNIPYRVVKEGYENTFSDEDDTEYVNPSFLALKELYGGDKK